jgi:hypothetical protein
MKTKNRRHCRRDGPSRSTRELDTGVLLQDMITTSMYDYWEEGNHAVPLARDFATAYFVLVAAPYSPPL